MKHEIEFIVEIEGEVTRLLSPGVGHFSAAVPSGRVLVPGDEAGVLRTLDTSSHLIVPPTVSGRVVSEPPQRVHHPVDYGTCLYELSSVGEALVLETEDDPTIVAGGLSILAPHAGRFWHSPAPGEAPFAAVGRELVEGDAVGVLEVMKTFNNVSYRATRGLPERARITTVLVADGEEVEEGQALLTVEGR